MQGFQEEDFTERFNLKLWKDILHIAKPYHKNLVVIMVSMLLSAVVDVVTPLMNAYAIDNFIANRTTAGMPGFIALYIGIILVQVVLILVFLQQCGMVEVETCYLIRKKGFRKLQELPFAYYDRMPVGYLMSRLTNDTQRLGETIGWSLCDICYGIAYVIICATQMIRLDWRLGLTVMLVIPPLAVISWKFQKAILKNQRKVRKHNSQITAAFNEGINGAKTTKTLVREEENSREFDKIATGMRQASIRSATLSSLFLPIVVSLGSFAAAYALVKGGHTVLAGGAMTIGTLQVFVSYTVQLFDPILSVARTFAEMQSSQAAAERVMSLLSTEADIKDTPEVIAEYGDSFNPKKENWPPITGDIEFRDVTFQYSQGEKVLSHFNLKVTHGQTIALVGETGSGKSTIVNLLCRFYEPTEGEILIDGHEYRTRSQLWLQSSLGYVLQSPHLFSGTVAENIKYGCPDATDEEVRNAAKMVGADKFIMNMPDGYDANVGEGGSRLSTGQKQLISFARAIVKNPAIFVLDEATSSVDTETEQLIQSAITSTLKGRTSFIVAHRLSTIRSCDRILVINQGKIVEDGTHRQLIAKQGYYYRLYTNQFQEEQWQAIESENK